MFWETEQPTESTLDLLLEKPGVGLLEILDEPTCAQELRCENKKLLAYLSEEDRMLEMLRYALALKFPEGETQARDNDGSENGFFDKNKYKYANLCHNLLSCAMKALRDEVEANEAFMHILLNFLKEDNAELSPLVVSFYTGLISSLIQFHSDGTFEPLIKRFAESDLLDQCFANLHLSAVNELLCQIGSALPDPEYRTAYKNWFMEKKFAQKLVDCFAHDVAPEVHENAAQVWSEYISQLRDLQYNVEQTEDPLLDSLTEHSIRPLLTRIFGYDGTGTEDTNERPEYVQTDSVLANGVFVLNAMLDTKLDQNAPSVLFAQNNKHPGLSSTLQDSSYIADPDRIVEHAIAEYAPRIVQLALESAQAPLSENRGDVLVQLMQLLCHLLNTNDLQTHNELLKAFSCEETSLKRFFEVFEANPSMTIFNTLLTTMVLHILWSQTAEETPLLAYLIDEVGLMTMIRHKLRSMPKEEDFVRRIARRSFWMYLADKLEHSRYNAPMLIAIGAKMMATADHNKWENFFQSSMRMYSEQNRSQSVSEIASGTERNLDIAIDELDEGSPLSFSHLPERDPMTSTPERPWMFRTPILFSPPESTSGIFQGLRRAESEPVVSPTKPAASGDRPGSPTVQLFEELMNARKESPRSATSSTAATAGEDEWPGMAASAIADDWPKTSAASVKSSGDELFGVDFQPAASFDFGAGLAVKNGGSGEQPSREIADALINGVKKYTEAAPALTEKGITTTPKKPPSGAPAADNDWPTTPPKQQQTPQNAFAVFDSPKVTLQSNCVSDDEC